MALPTSLQQVVNIYTRLSHTNTTIHMHTNTWHASEATGCFIGKCLPVAVCLPVAPQESLRLRRRIESSGHRCIGVGPSGRARVCGCGKFVYNLSTRNNHSLSRGSRWWAGDDNCQLSALLATCWQMSSSSSSSLVSFPPCELGCDFPAQLYRKKPIAREILAHTWTKRRWENETPSYKIAIYDHFANAGRNDVDVMRKFHVEISWITKTDCTEPCPCPCLVGRSFGTNQHMQLWLVCFFSPQFFSHAKRRPISMRNVWNFFLENSLGAWTLDRRYGKSTQYNTLPWKLALSCGTAATAENRTYAWYVLSAYDANLDAHTWFPVPHGPVSSTCPAPFVFPSNSHALPKR